MLPSIGDPFEIVKEEVQANVQKAKLMHEQWRRLLEAENTSDSRRFQDLHTELLGELQQLDFDLSEVDRSITAVDTNRDRFQLSNEELQARKEFVKSSRRVYQGIREELSSRRTAAKMEDDRRQQLLRQRNEEHQKRAVQEEDAWRHEELQMQKKLITAQDDELVLLSKTTATLHDVALAVNEEVGKQNEMLEELDKAMDTEMGKMTGLVSGVGTLLKTKNRWQIYAVLILIVLFFLMLTLFIWT